MSISSETLIAYVDGELSDGERAEVEAALAIDESFRARVARERALRQRLSAAFDPTLTEALPANLMTFANTNESGNVVALKPKRATWTYREWGAMAASLAGGLMLGLGAMHTQTPTLAPSAHGLVARGTLAQALETQLAADTDGAVRIGITFRRQDGAYCRTFGVTRDHVAGLACREGEEWRVPLTTQFTPITGEIRTAGSDTPAVILTQVDSMIAGEPLDAGAEIVARRRHWRPGQ